ncbi:MAG: hypothetical protein AAFR61_04150 [Bacteroidota bacterium]
MTQVSIQEQAYAAIRDGHIENTLDLLRAWMNTHATHELIKLDYLSSRWKRIQQDKKLRLIQIAEAYREENKIIWDLLKLVEEMAV